MSNPKTTYVMKKNDSKDLIMGQQKVHVQENIVKDKEMFVLSYSGKAGCDDSELPLRSGGRSFAL